MRFTHGGIADGQKFGGKLMTADNLFWHELGILLTPCTNSYSINQSKMLSHPK